MSWGRLLFLLTVTALLVFIFYSPPESCAEETIRAFIAEQ